MTDVDELSVNALRFLSVDMVEAANSGHPGLPLGAAPMAYVLWDRFLRHDPAEPGWADRDRFVLSAGHGSALLYALLHLTGYDLPLSELQRFRQWGSRTPGHPEAELTRGVEVTTGPLGQGLAMAVGLAIAERVLARTFNRDGFEVVDHRTWVIASDGDLMEGVSAEAASLAGTVGLGRLTVLYDANEVSLEGPTRLAFTEDVAARFASYGWSVDRVEDGNDLADLERALATARSDLSRPHLIVVRTHIGYGSPKQDTKEAHGSPLGAAAARATKERLGWPAEPAFHVPDAARAHLGRARSRGEKARADWNELLDRYRTVHPELAAAFDRSQRGELPPGWADGLPAFGPKGGELATREASARVLNALASKVPTLVGGSADLAPSTNTLIAGEASFLGGAPGRNLHFGVREHAMVAALNGMAMHGGLWPYGSTFLIFVDYARPAVRLAALMRAHILLILTHDSIGAGEDGPTHQPIEQLWGLRMIPGLTLFRPADGAETAAAWRVGLPLSGPVVFALTRQKLPPLPVPADVIDAGVARGAYIVRDAVRVPDLVLIATGSEVHAALRAADLLAGEGRAVRVVSAPSLERFDAQPPEYRQLVLPRGVPRLAVEAGSPHGWWKYVGDSGEVIGLERFGASAPGPTVLERLGFGAPAIAERARSLLARNSPSGPGAARSASP